MSQDVKKYNALIVTGIGTALATGLTLLSGSEVAAGVAGTIVTGLASVSAGMLGNLVSDVISPHVCNRLATQRLSLNELNHDLRQAYLNAAQNAITYLSELFGEETGYTDEDRKIAEEFFRAWGNQYGEYIHRYITETSIPEEKDVINPESLIKNWQETNKETILKLCKEEVNDRFAEFVVDKFEDIIKVTFVEELKNPDDKAWKAYQLQVYQASFDLMNDILNKTVSIEQIKSLNEEQNKNLIQDISKLISRIKPNGEIVLIPEVEIKAAEWRTETEKQLKYLIQIDETGKKILILNEKILVVVTDTQEVVKRSDTKITDTQEVVKRSDTKLDQILNIVSSGANEPKKVLPVNYYMVKSRFGLLKRLFYFWVAKRDKWRTAFELLGNLDNASINRFIKVTQNFLPLQLQYEDVQHASKFNFVQELYKKLSNPKSDKDKYYLLLGESGVGKTTGLQYMFAELAIRQSTFNVIYDTCANILSYIDTISLKGKTILLIDAFDEHPEAFQNQTKLFDTLEEATKEFAKVLIVCRKQFFSTTNQERSVSIRNEKYIKVYVPLISVDSKALEIFLGNIYNTENDPNNTKRGKAFEIIRKSHKLLVRPILLYYIQDIVDNLQGYRYINESITEYESYRAIIDQWIKREKPTIRSFNKKSDETTLLLVSKTVAMATYQLEQIDINKPAGIFDADMAAIVENNEGGLNALVLKDRTLLHRSTDNYYRFAHRSFKEFFYAHLVFDGNIKEKDIDKSRFKDAWVFYTQMCQVECFEFVCNNKMVKLNEANSILKDYYIQHLKEEIPCFAIHTYLRFFFPNIDKKADDICYSYYKQMTVDHVYGRDLLTLLTKMSEHCINNNRLSVPLEEVENCLKQLDDAVIKHEQIAKLPFLVFTNNEYRFFHRSFPEFIYLYQILHNDDAANREKMLSSDIFKKMRFAHLFGQEINWLTHIYPMQNQIRILLDNYDISTEEFRKLKETQPDLSYYEYASKKAPINFNDYDDFLSRLSKTEMVKIKASGLSDFFFLQHFPYAGAITHLDLADNTLAGTLDLSGFGKLVELHLEQNIIGEALDIVLPKKLQTIHLPNNTSPDIVTSLKDKYANLIENADDSLLSDFTKTASDTPEMVEIDGGVFLMGSKRAEDREAQTDELPAHEVTLSSFYLGKYPVTRVEFAAFVKETGYLTQAEREGFGFASYLRTSDNTYTDFLKVGCCWKHDVEGEPITEAFARHPVIQVSWYDAIAYCNWLSQKHELSPAYKISAKNVILDSQANGFRLPTEAEWEFAARGGIKASERFLYAGSNKIDEVAWYWGNSGRSTQPVGKKNPNELGLYDMSGNVLEWCWDWYSADYYKNSPAQNPRGPEKGDFRVVRGGSWISDPRGCRVAARHDPLPDTRYDNLGFRVCRVLVRL